MSRYRGLIDNFILIHPRFEAAVSIAQWGSLLLIDSTIVQHVLRMATDLGIPVLTVHKKIIIAAPASLIVEDLSSIDKIPSLFYSMALFFFGVLF